MRKLTTFLVVAGFAVAFAGAASACPGVTASTDQPVQTASVDTKGK